MIDTLHPESGAGDGQNQKTKITLVFVDGHAPGIVEFLGSLPARTETAFIRGLIYQWMIDNQGADDYERRLLAVLNGPGGRPTFGLQGAIAQSTAPRPAAPRPAPRRRAQTVMPLGDAPRHQVSDSAAEKVVPGSPASALPPVSSPAPVHPAASNPLPQHVPVPPPSPTPAVSAIPSSQPTQPEPPDAEVVAEADGEMNPFDSFF